MRSLLLPLVALVALPLLSAAQDPSGEYRKSFEEGIAALTDGRHDDGIAAFQRCLELRPEEPTCAYNVACGFSLKGEKDDAFSWLDRAAEWGFGHPDGNIAHAKQDSDLAALREDERFAKFIARMEEMHAKAREYADSPAVYIPEALADAKQIPLLVVLHDAGSTKDDVVKGRWRAIAEELGMALLAPSGTIPVKGEPAQGMAWFMNPDEYTNRYWIFERPVNDAVTAFKKEHSVDPTRVVVAGEGQGATVAFNVGIAGPGLYKAALAVDGAVHLQLARSKGANAGKLGFRARVLLPLPAAEDPGRKEIEDYAEAVNDSFEQWGVDGTLELYEPGEDGAVERARLVAALEVLLPVSEAVEAGASDG